MVMTPEAKVKKVVVRQRKNLTDIELAGGIAIVVNEKNMNDVEETLFVLERMM